MDDGKLRAELRWVSRKHKSKRVFIPAEMSHPRGQFLSSTAGDNHWLNGFHRVKALFVQIYGKDAPRACHHCQESYQKNVTKGGSEHYTSPYHICRILPWLDDKCGNCLSSNLPCMAGRDYAFTEADARNLSMVYSGDKTTVVTLDDWLESLEVCPRIISADFVGWGQEDRDRVVDALKAAYEKMPAPSFATARTPAPPRQARALHGKLLASATPMATKGQSNWSTSSVSTAKLMESFSPAVLGGATPASTASTASAPKLPDNLTVQTPKPRQKQKQVFNLDAALELSPATGTEQPEKAKAGSALSPPTDSGPSPRKRQATSALNVRKTKRQQVANQPSPSTRAVPSVRKKPAVVAGSSATKARSPRKQTAAAVPSVVIESDSDLDGAANEEFTADDVRRKLFYSEPKNEI